MCHGLPGQAAPAAAKGMFPPPPQLLQKDETVTDDPPERPSGKQEWDSPHRDASFGSSLSTQQIWQVSLLLANADKLPPSVQQALASPSTAAQASK